MLVSPFQEKKKKQTDLETVLELLLTLAVP